MAIQTLSTNTPVRSQNVFPRGEPPASARVVIVGGGIAGCSVVYHLAKLGWKDVVLLESGKIASGTTWHSAGQVGQLRASSVQTKINKASAELYAELSAETGHETGWLQCGGLQIATCEERWTQLRRNAAMAEVFGVDAHLITPQEVADRWPVIKTSDVIGAIWLPGDGRVLPGECSVALAKGAEADGVTICEDVRVEELIMRDGRATGVRTEAGQIDADWVVLTGGMWTRQLGLAAGVDIPLYPCEHHYLVTAPLDGVTRDFPCCRDPDAGLYFRSLDDGGMKLGAFKLRSKAWRVGNEVPNDFHFSLLDPDWEDFAEPLAAHHHRLPGTRDLKITKFVNGPESFTPDNNFLMGEPNGTEGLFVLAGFNSAGIACAGGAGKYTAEWMENGGMTADLLSMDIRRFGPRHNQLDFLQERVTEVLGMHYAMAWPGRQMETARDVTHTPLFRRHQDNGARFGEVSGIERPMWFGGPEPGYTFGKPVWLETVSAEVAACRSGVAVFDQSTFSKFESSDLERLQCLCGNNIDVEIGKSVYTAMLNERGTFESDLTVIRRAEDRFYIVSSTASRWRDFAWIGSDVRDVTEQMGVLGVMGPRSRALLSKLTDADLSNAAFPFGAAREIMIAGQTVLAVRITYVGELGWELHISADGMLPVYDAIKAAGASDAGHHTINAMRIEKAYRAFGHELSPDETPLEAGLGFAVHWEKDFLGRDALLAQQEAGALKRRLASFVLEDPEIMLWGGEPIVSGSGEVLGYTSSATFGPTLGRSVAMGYVWQEKIDGDYRIICAGVPCVAKMSRRAPFDPKRERILC